MFRRRISWLAILAVALCVFMVVVVMTVLSGLVSEFKEKNHKFAGDCVAGTRSMVGFPYYEEFIAELGKADFVQAASPVIKSWALLSPTGMDMNKGVQIMGVDPNSHCEATSWGKSLYYHRDNCRNAFVPHYEPNRPGIVVGIEMMDIKNERGTFTHKAMAPSFELAISCFPLTPKGTLTKMATGLVNTKVFVFSDDSHTGLADADTEQVYVSFADLQALCGMSMGTKRASAIFIKFKNGDDVDAGTMRVQNLWNDFVSKLPENNYKALLDTVRVESWKEYARESVAPMEKEETMMMLLFGLIGLITVFIIFVIFYMIVTHKTKDIGILKSSGAGSSEILQLFLIVAGTIAVIGSAIGQTAGILFLKNINRIEEWLYNHFGFQLWDRSMYAIEQIPNTLKPEVLLVIFLAALIACLAGAFLPAYAASKKRPAEILQVNQL
jgi:ABC-type lipoprotein release transport system permease subunit